MLIGRIRRKAGLGFTLVEMIAAILILAILAAIAAPSFQTAISNAAVKGNAESIYQGLQIARSEAVRQNLKAHIDINSDKSWAVVAETSPITTIQTKPATEGSGGGISLAFTPATATRVTFNALGRATPNTNGSTQLSQIDISSSGTTTTRRIVISGVSGATAGGQLTLCDPAAATGDPKACP
jgi:type IV fimbrial biogenesis protein FimT